VRSLVKCIVLAELVALIAFNVALRLSDAAEPGRSGPGKVDAYSR